MLAHKLIAFSLSFFILSESLASICHAGIEQNNTIHFIFESCEDHACDPGAETSNCSPENCEHKFCNDQSITGDYFPSLINQFVGTYPAPVASSDIFYSAAYSKGSLFLFSDPPFITAYRSTILRI